MPFVLLIIGALTITSAIKGTSAQLGQQVVSDLKGSAGNVGFIYWVSALIAVGALGYYQPIQKFSRAFMMLIIIGMVLATKGGIFSRLQEALKNPVEPSSSGATSASSTSSTTTTQTTSLATGQAEITAATKYLETFTGA